MAISRDLELLRKQITARLVGDKETPGLYQNIARGACTDMPAYARAVGIVSGYEEVLRMIEKLGKGEDEPLPADFNFHQGMH